MSRFFSLFTDKHLSDLLTLRAGETRLGQCVHVPVTGTAVEEAIQLSNAKFVLLGIPEDIGVRANMGIGGAASAWPLALRSLLHIQSTPAFSGAELLILGHFDFSEWMVESRQADTDALRKLTARIDEEVAPVISTIVAAGKIPIVIGGGHNNAYPLLKGVSDALGHPVHCINLDAHSDYRRMEGRHSGNGFRYAREHGYLDRYAIVGLHESYNAADIVATISKETYLHASFFEDIFIRHKFSFAEALSGAAAHLKGGISGVELDMDAIEGVLSSAQTPSGISTREARQYIHFCTHALIPCYLHLPEAAAVLNGRTDEAPLTGKLLAYLIADFIKGMAARHH